MVGVKETCQDVCSSSVAIYCTTMYKGLNTSRTLVSSSLKWGQRWMASSLPWLCNLDSVTNGTSLRWELWECTLLKGNCYHSYVYCPVPIGVWIPKGHTCQPCCLQSSLWELWDQERPSPKTRTTLSLVHWLKTKNKRHGVSPLHATLAKVYYA